MPRCCTHLIQPTILGCFHLKVREPYRKPVIITERPPSLSTVQEKGREELRFRRTKSERFLYTWHRFRRERYCHFSEISQLALLYLLSQEPKWNVPLKIWAHGKVPPVTPEIFRLPSDGTVILSIVCSRLK